MSSNTSVDSTKLCDSDRTEGGLFLCESDLIGALLLPHYTTAAQSATLLPDAGKSLLTLNGHLPSSGC